MVHHTNKPTASYANARLERAFADTLSTDYSNKGDFTIQWEIKRPFSFTETKNTHAAPFQGQFATTLTGVLLQGFVRCRRATHADYSKCDSLQLGC